MQNFTSADAFNVSVVIPTHNRLQTLKEAISSALEQTLLPLEIIVVDDGSTDGSSDWLENQPLPVSFLCQPNHGVSHARNRGIEKARGQWIAFLDSDDYWHKNKLEKQYKALRSEQGHRLCHCDEIWIRNGKRINPKHKHQKRGGYIFEHCLPLCAISPSAVIMHRDLFYDHGLFDESLPACEDYDLWLRVTSQEAVSYVDEMLLTKTGGHADQLSQRYAIMDQFRIKSLDKLLKDNKLDFNKRESATTMLLTKLDIVMKGARKHNNELLMAQLTRQYPQWINQLPAINTHE